MIIDFKGMSQVKIVFSSNLSDTFCRHQIFSQRFLRTSICHGNKCMAFRTTEIDDETEEYSGYCGAESLPPQDTKQYFP